MYYSLFLALGTSMLLSLWTTYEVARVLPSEGPVSIHNSQDASGEDNPRHGVPAQLLSDRGTTFLSKLLAEVYKSWA